MAGEQPVEPGDADVVDRDGLLAHRLRRDARLLGDGHVGGPGGDDGHPAPPRRRRRARDRDGPRAGVVHGARDLGEEAREPLALDAGHEQPIAAGEDLVRDAHQVGGRLPGRVDDLGVPAPQRAVVVDRRDGRPGLPLGVERVRVEMRQALGRGPDGEVAAADGLEEGQEAFAVHAAMEPRRDRERPDAGPRPR